MQSSKFAKESSEIRLTPSHHVSTPSITSGSFTDQSSSKPPRLKELDENDSEADESEEADEILSQEPNPKHSGHVSIGVSNTMSNQLSGQLSKFPRRSDFMPRISELDGEYIDMIREAREINHPESTYVISQTVFTEDRDEFDIEESFA